LLWGWPDRFIDRMTGVGSTVLLRGPYGSADDSDGIDQPKYADLIPPGFPGYVWTNDINVLLLSRAFAVRAVRRQSENGESQRSNHCEPSFYR
jgi:hypothetical protein